MLENMWKDIRSQHARITVTPSVGTVATTGSVKLVGAAQDREGLYIYNNGGNTIYIAFGSPANSANNMTLQIAAFSTWTMTWPTFLGEIWGIRNAGSGTCLVTELYK